MVKQFKLWLSAWLCLGLTSAYAVSNDAIQTQIKQNLKKNLPDLVIDQIRVTPFAGLYEVDSGRKVFYVDATGNYAVIGNLVDLINKTSLTQNRTESLNKVNWANLPLDLAIHRTIGRGSNRIAVFTDPDCPFCQRLEAETLPKLTDVTIYYFLFPLPIHANASENSKKILCAENPESSLIAYMAKSKPLGKNTTCNNANKLAKMQDIGTNVVQVSGTPTIVLPNGRLISGLVPADYLARLINENQTESAVEQ
jgi:thiol:disulfide interchange protein DsbC